MERIIQQAYKVQDVSRLRLLCQVIKEPSPRYVTLQFNWITHFQKVLHYQLTKHTVILLFQVKNVTHLLYIKEQIEIFAHFSSDLDRSLQNLSFVHLELPLVFCQKPLIN